MKIIIVLSFLTVLCTIEAAPTSIELEILRRQARNLKWNVDTIERQLDLLKNQIKEDTDREIVLKWEDEQNSYRTYKTLLISGINKEVNAAKAAGKDVEECREIAREGIEGYQNTTRSQTKKCISNAHTNIDHNLGFITNLISIAQQLSADLGDVFLTCHDSEIRRMETCIIAELARLEISLRDLESDCITAEIAARHVNKNVITQAGNCIRQAYSVLYSGGVAIKIGVTECIDQAQTTSAPTTLPPTTTTKNPCSKTKDGSCTP